MATVTIPSSRHIANCPLSEMADTGHLPLAPMNPWTRSNVGML
jgi:hypothetical protein